jgi:hypothetical protein
MTSAHVRPISFSIAEAIWAAVARSPSCAEPNMPATRASLSMMSATIAADLDQLRLARFADEHNAHEETHPSIKKFRGGLADFGRTAALVGSEPNPGSTMIKPVPRPTIDGRNA